MEVWIVETMIMVVVFAFLIETIVEALKPLIYRLEGLGEKLGAEMSYLFS